MLSDQFGVNSNVPSGPIMNGNAPRLRVLGPLPHAVGPETDKNVAVEVMPDIACTPVPVSVQMKPSAVPNNPPLVEAKASDEVASVLGGVNWYTF